jgi:hypothetical protein
MKDEYSFRKRTLGYAVATMLIFMLSSRAFVMAQSAGNNAVYNGSSVVSSKAFLDAYAASLSTPGDFCAKLGAALGTLVSGTAGMVVDARGLSIAAGCSSDPFASLTSGLSVKILLPAGTLSMTHSWAIHDQSQIVGEGPARTILQASTSGFSDPYASPNTAILHMGKPSIGGVGGGIVFEVRIEHLTLDGQGQTLDGIDNQNAEELSYVDDVAINNVNGNGIFLALDPAGRMNGGSDHSGPYTNITFQTSSAVSGTACVNVQFSEPRALYGVTCIGNASSNGAILLDGGNVAVEDVRIDGFQEGIRIGSQSGGVDSGQNDLVMNITGTNTVNTTGTANLVHIYSGSTGNITVSGVTSVGTNSILDSLTGTTLTDSHIGIYILGQAVSGGYSRFTTSPNRPNWAVASSAPAGNCTANGSLLSNTTGVLGSTLWVCANNGTANKWTAVK